MFFLEISSDIYLVFMVINFFRTLFRRLLFGMFVDKKKLCTYFAQ